MAKTAIEEFNRKVAAERERLRKEAERRKKLAACDAVRDAAVALVMKYEYPKARAKFVDALLAYRNAGFEKEVAATRKLADRYWEERKLFDRLYDYGRAGKLAHRFARGEDDRPVVSRRQARRLAVGHEFETPLVERERLLAALKRLVRPLSSDLRGDLHACGQVRLAIQYGNGQAEEGTRTFLLPTAAEDALVSALGQLVDQMAWPAPAPNVIHAWRQELVFLPGCQPRLLSLV